MEVRALNIAWPSAKPIWATPPTSTRYAAAYVPCSVGLGAVTAATRPPAMTQSTPMRAKGSNSCRCTTGKLTSSVAGGGGELKSLSWAAIPLGDRPTGNRPDETGGSKHTQHGDGLAGFVGKADPLALVEQDDNAWSHDLLVLAAADQ